MKSIAKDRMRIIMIAANIRIKTYRDGRVAQRMASLSAG